MDYSNLIGKPVKLKLKSGKTLIGSIQQWKDQSLQNQQIPFLQDKNQIRMQEIYGKEFNVEIPVEEGAKFIDLINPNEIDEVVAIETVVNKIQTITEGGKKIGIPGFKLELRGTGKPGRISASYWLPDKDKKFDLGELEIKDSTLWLPVTMAFISYAKEDVKKVTDISNELSDNGIVPWFDNDMLLPGDNWQNRIVRGVKSLIDFTAVRNKGSPIKRHPSIEKSYPLKEN